ncbi:MAG: Prolyl endopeptidase [Pseudomonadota bacterium]|jgi:prolyl oligopeptidase
MKTLIAALAVVALPWACPLALARTVAGVDLPAPYTPCPGVDTYWGEKIEDPYRCLENTADPAVQAYMKAQADAATAVLARIPGRDKLLLRIQEIDAEVPANVADLSRDRSGNLFYEKRLASDNQFKLYMRRGLEGPEKILVDPEVLAKATGKPHAIGSYAHSPDGKRVAYSVSAGGAEIGTLHVIDTETGRELMPPIDRIRGGLVQWAEDGSAFFVSRLAPGWEQRPRVERFMDNTVYLKRLADPAAETAVFGPTVHPELQLGRADNAVVILIADQPLAAALVFHGVSRYRSLYLSDKDALLAGKPVWRKVFDQSAQVNDIAVHGHWLYVRSAKGAPRFQLLRLALPDADLAKAELLLPGSKDVITGIAAAPEGLYVTRREGPVERLWRLPHGAGVGAALQAVPLPVEGSVGLAHADGRLPGVVVTLAGWTRAERHYLVGAEPGAPRDLALAPVGRFDAPPGMMAREVMVKSHDGVEVPVSIISRRDLKLDGSNPTMLYGYAAYGKVEDPTLSRRLLAWLEQGGVFVICHARGGGIFGDEWHQAGQKTRKFNTWRDGIAAAEWLIANGYTSPARLSVLGGSAGGIFVGRVVTERPDLFSAAALIVGNLDQIRSETRANGAANIPEYGTVKVEAEFRALRNNSTYEHIRQGTAYPALLFEHGVNDIRVDVWMSTKVATRFSAANESGKPVLMRLEYDAGHGAGSTRLQAQRQTADRWAFFLWQAGVPAFQPKP